MVEDKIKFYFPTTRLTKDDYSPIESELLKDHYRNSFLKLLDKVSNKIIHLYNKDREKK
jgi:hypothetical protein